MGVILRIYYGSIAPKSYFHIIYISHKKGISMQTVSVSQIQRNLHQLNKFDIIEIIDKKRNQTNCRI